MFYYKFLVHGGRRKRVLEEYENETIIAQVINSFKSTPFEGVTVCTNNIPTGKTLKKSIFLNRINFS